MSAWWSANPLGVVIARLITGRLHFADHPPTQQPASSSGAAAGVGCTVALFIAELAMPDPARPADAKLSILVASLSAARASYTLLWRPAR